MVQLVPRLAVRWREVVAACRSLGAEALEDRPELLAQETLALLPALPDVEDPEDVVVEAGRVDEQAVGRIGQVQRLDHGVVVGGARVAVADLELLEVRNRHRRFLSSGARMLGKSPCRRAAISKGRPGEARGPLPV